MRVISGACCSAAEALDADYETQAQRSVPGQMRCLRAALAFAFFLIRLTSDGQTNGKRKTEDRCGDCG